MKSTSKISKLLFFTLITNLIFFSVLFASHCGLVYAQEINQLELPKTAVNPGSFYYPVKRLWEKGREKLLFSEQSKVTFHKSLLKIRLAELNYVVEKNLLSVVQTSSERFAYTAGILTEELIKQNKDKEITIKEFQQMQKFLERLRDKYVANTSFWMLIQHDINSLNILSDQLK